jgi:hypothetical protein
VRVAFEESGELGGTEPRVHASEDRKVSRRRHGGFGFITKVGGVFLVGCKYFLKNFARNSSSVEEWRNAFVHRRWKSDTCNCRIADRALVD